MARTLPTLLAAILAVSVQTTVPAKAEGIFVTPELAERPRAALTGQRANIARELPLFGYLDVDVASLSSSQVAHISHLIYSGRSMSEVRGQIGATLRRGFLQRQVDRITR